LDQARTIRIVAGVSAWPPSTRAWRPRCAPTISDGPRPRASARQEPAGFVVAKPAAARAPRRGWPAACNLAGQVCRAGASRRFDEEARWLCAPCAFKAVQRHLA